MVLFEAGYYQSLVALVQMGQADQAFAYSFWPAQLTPVRSVDTPWQSEPVDQGGSWQMADYSVDGVDEVSEPAPGLAMAGPDTEGSSSGWNPVDFTVVDTEAVDEASPDGDVGASAPPSGTWQPLDFMITDSTPLTIVADVSSTAAAVPMLETLWMAEASEAQSTVTVADWTPMPSDMSAGLMQSVGFIDYHSMIGAWF